MFAQSWEDPECDRKALRIRSGDDVVAITSGGDNVLDLLLDDPARIVAVDINPAQAYLFELKRAAFVHLDYPGLIRLLGVDGTSNSFEKYRIVRDTISLSARNFFDARESWFEAGLLTQGGFERYFAILRRIIALAVGSKTMSRLFELEPGQQPAFYEEQWDGWRWRALMRIGCSKALLGNRLDPTWFADSEAADFGRHFTGLAQHVLTRLPARENYFLSQILLGRYSGNSMPTYLQEENFATIRERINRVQVVTAGIEDGLRALADNSIDAFALSNVFEYSPVDVFEVAKDEIVRVAKPGARIAHRNLLAPRRFGQDYRFNVDPELSDVLRASDRGFIYSHFEAGSLA
ncbi:DUF3419 family protein [Erythrobacter gaetbuli]|uniref:DUF3419 family protein n=1 Tax=Qipengyuania gaetbuli TaxID=266952 RepID=A0A844XX68_9SPHN|nr:DUF3419 family protein [Qipengyuania gaetbuli]MXO49703.1 DUF3419 family protein [Qipengyuania gaetbuli]